MEIVIYILLGLGVIIGVAVAAFKLIFMFLGWIFQGPTAKASPNQCCPRCRTAFRQGTQECTICFWPNAVVATDRSNSIVAALRLQLWRYEQLQLLPPAQVRELVERLTQPLQEIPQAKDQPLYIAELADEVTPPTATPAVEVPSTTVSDEALPNWPRSSEAEQPRHKEPAPFAPQFDPYRLAIPGDLASSPAQPAEESTVEPASHKPDLAERARRFTERQQAAAAAEAEPVTAASAPGEAWFSPAAQAALGMEQPLGRSTSSAARPPIGRTPLTTILSAFLEEKNIRWGELIGGLLIICCSIALVISFWAQINERPLFKFSLFNGVTAAIFAMGFYTERRWKIRTTSLGLLLIGALLVPLNFLAIAAFTDQIPPTDLLGLGGEGLSLVLFSALVYYAARELTPRFELTTTIGLILPCLWQLLTRRFIGDDASSPQIYLFAAVPLASYLVGMAVPLERLRHAVRWNERRANRMFTLWLILTASTVLPWALLLYKTGNPQTTLQLLSPLLVVAGLPSLAIGLLSAKKIISPSLLKLRITGMSLGLLGAALMIGALVLAWPAVEFLLPVLLVNITLFALAAWRLKLPGAYVPAGVGAMTAGLLIGALVRGELTWDDHSASRLLAATLSMTGGISLAVMSLGFFALAALWQRPKHAAEAHWFTRLGQFAAAVGFSLAVYWGAGRIGDPENATWVFGTYTIGLITAAVLSKRQTYGWLASVVLLLTVAQAVVFRWADQAWPAPWLIALLVHATLLAVAAIGPRFIAPTRTAPWQPLLLTSSLVTSIAAAIGMVYWITALDWSTSATLTGWIAVVWLLLSVAKPSPELLIAAQQVSAITIALAVTAFVATSDWYQAAKHAWLDPRFISAQALAIGAQSLFWTLFTAAIDWLNKRRVRQAFVPATTACEPLEHFSSEPQTSTVSDAIAIEANKPNSKPISVEGKTQTLGRELLAAWRRADPGIFARVCSWAATGALLFLALVAVVPGIAQELSPVIGSAPLVRTMELAPPASEFELPGMPHEHAAGGTTILLLALVLAALAVRWVHCREPWQLLGFLLCLGCGLLLWATRWEPELAVASAVRWLMSGFVLAGSLALWGQGWFTRLLDRVGLSTSDADRNESTTILMRRMLLGMAVVTYLGIILCITSCSLEPPRTAGLTIGFSTITGVLIVAVLGGMMLDRWIFAANSATALSMGDPRRLTTSVTLTVSGFVLLGLTVWGAFAAWSLPIRPLIGPLPGSWFAGMGNSFSYGVPLLAIAAALFNFAWRERFEVLLFAAQLTLNVLFSTVYLILRIEQGGALDAEAMIQLALGNALLSAMMSIIWYAVIRWQPMAKPAADDRTSTLVSPLLLSQVLLATVLLWLPLVPAIMSIIVHPTAMSWFAAAGSWWAWVAAAAVLSATLLILPRSFVRSSEFLGAAGTTLAALIPLSLTPWDRGDWLVYHVLAAGMAAAATGVLATETWLRRRGERAELPWRRWAGCLMLLTIGLGLRALFGDPASPWWTIGLWLAAAAQLAWASGLAAQREPLWLIPWLVGAAASLAWVERNPLRYPESLLELLWINILAGTVSMLVSLVLELRCFARRPDTPLRRLIPLHQLLAWLGTAALGITTYYSINADLAQVPFNTPAWLPAAALGALLLATFACLWDSGMKQTVAMLYCLGLVAAGMFVDVLDTQGQLFVLIVTVALAAYSLATSYLWSIRAGLRKLAAAWKMPVEEHDATPGYFGEDGQGWLVTANGLLSLIVTVLVFWSVFHLEENSWRLICVQAILVQTIALGLLARGAVRSVLQYTTLGMGVLFVLAWGFALLPLEVTSPLLHRVVTAAVAISITVPIYGLGIVKVLRTENEWTRAAQKLLPLLMGLASALFLVVLGIETWQFLETGSAGIAVPGLLAVAAALICLAVAALAAAVLPGRDPLQLSERGKTAYVYAAEVLLGLLFLHIRVSMPWLFRGWFAQFWPLIVMAIAFVGVGFSEFCRRRKLSVLAEPLERTGALLPLLPVLGMWFLPSSVHGSLVLLAVGALYLTLSILRSSLLFTGLALLAVNGSLWVYLQGFPGLEIYHHPQLWIIPPTLCVLVAAQMNRDRLTEEQQTSLRYFAAMVLYGSSCADVFINGVKVAPWLPLVLAALSIAGVFAGIMLRVRAFLYLGTVFLLVALFTMIWYAAVELDRTWIWWVCGIVTGVLIIALFGLFEKKRDEMLRLVDKLKQWEA